MSLSWITRSTVARVADVAMDERVARIIADIGQIVQVAGIGEFIVDDDVVVGILFEQVVDEVAPMKPAPPVTRKFFMIPFP